MPMPQGAQDPMSFSSGSCHKIRPPSKTRGRNTILNKFLKSSATVHKEEMKGKEEE